MGTWERGLSLAIPSTTNWPTPVLFSPIQFQESIRNRSLAEPGHWCAHHIVAEFWSRLAEVIRMSTTEHNQIIECFSFPSCSRAWKGSVNDRVFGQSTDVNSCQSPVAECCSSYTVTSGGAPNGTELTCFFHQMVYTCDKCVDGSEETWLIHVLSLFLSKMKWLDPYNTNLYSRNNFCWNSEKFMKVWWLEFQLYMEMNLFYIDCNFENCLHGSLWIFKLSNGIIEIRYNFHQGGRIG